MNPFGDGSSGALNVTSGTTNLALNTKHQFTTVNIASGATLSTNSSTGSVLYICASQSFTLDGTIDLSNKVNYGNNTWGITIDGSTFNSPGVANGGGGGLYTGQTAGSQGNGFGGGGGGVIMTASAGGNGGSGGTPGGAGGGSTYSTGSTNVVAIANGNAGGTSSGGGGSATSNFSRLSGNVTGNSFSGNTGAGGWAYGNDGTDAQLNGSITITGGAGSYNGYYAAGGGGGAGGIAGRAGVHLVIKSPSIIVNGVIITSGTSGGNGGNGGRSQNNNSYTNSWGCAGGGGGGGNAGTVSLFYGSLLTDTSTKTMAAGSGGSRGSGATGFVPNGVNGSNGLSATASSTRLVPYTDFTASPTSGERPLNVSFTNLSAGAVSYLWDFGDSTTSTLENPTHTYSTVGTFTVTLTATNPAGSVVKTRASYITTTNASFSREAKGNIVLGGGADRKVNAKREAKGTITLGGGANGFIRRDTDAIEEKTFLYKVYDEDGTFIEVWPDVVEANQFTYSQEINQIGSVVEVELARNSDSLGTSTSPLLTEAGTTITTESGFPLLASTETKNQVGPGSSVNHNNRVDVFVFYGAVEPLLTEMGSEILTESGEVILAVTGAPNGRRIFTGYISDFNSRYGTAESTLVELTSFGADLENYPVRTSDNKTTVPFNSVDPAVMVRTSLDRFKADYALELYKSYTDYAPQTIQDTGTIISYTFRVNTYAEVLRKAVELMPANWYFYVGLGDNLVYFKPRQTEAIHTFYLGDHIQNLDLRSSIMGSTNRVLFTGGGDPALYKDYKEVPASRTRRSLFLYSDARVTLESSADILSEGVIEENNKVRYRTTVNILSKVYDIESINVGDTVGFRNFGNYVDDLVLQIVALTYATDIISLQLESKPVTVNKRLEDIKRQLTVADNQFVPDTPDV